MTGTDVINILKDIKEFSDIREIDYYISDLKKFTNILIILTPRINKGELAVAANMYLNNINQKFNTSFYCSRDEDTFIELIKANNYLNNLYQEKNLLKIGEGIERIVMSCNE
jgi:hypothetical protein